LHRGKHAEAVIEATVEKLKARRLELGYSLRQLAELSGISYTGIAQIESGDRSPTLYSLVMMAGALQIEIADLLVTPDALE